MKDYHQIALAWLVSRAHRPTNDDGKLTVEAVDEDAVVLSGLLKAAFEDGRAFEIGHMEEDTDDAGDASPERTQRDEEEFTQRTMKILGSTDRSLEDLKKVPHKRRAVAVHAQVEVEVLRDFLENRPVRHALATQIRNSLHRLGFYGEEKERS